ncbi:hypothetical protein PCASD_24259 [Puccinia coronata f. sp. avenae]|uniref:Uncharacterized protein n=1 Tax=Puccinia coronata f. sp. avenae TaxID=200324 RepID=A0A2N5TXE9_9BASI|nr:hypothetical protein PCASD_24259 [Puccinia coronata f. sp. avenae]
MGSDITLRSLHDPDVLCHHKSGCVVPVPRDQLASVFVTLDHFRTTQDEYFAKNLV